jgi:glyoxylase-like metal-dependent hydrolase (beta-lactamase superfamily II)
VEKRAGGPLEDDTQEKTMSKKRGTNLIAALFLWPLVASPSVCGQEAPDYEIYAIEYGVIPDVPLNLLVPGADSTLKVDDSLMVWLIRSPDGRNILVDSGFRWDVPIRVGLDFGGFPLEVQEYVPPDRAVAKLGLSPEDITDIIITHLHWDHADGISLFPNAHVWIQRAELEYYATSAWQPDGNNLGVEPRNVPELVKLNTEGRLTLVDGDDVEIFDGIRVYTGGRHTYASQYVGVNTPDGTVILASDNVWVYANLELNLANSLTFDAEAQVAAQDRMRELASKPEWIIPGHDRALFGKFPNPMARVARIR